mmetsp:Transcript_13624/g.34205  ORF Transcript_13624/g.34205 Transcript_13624/m.34205 type:complete len:424 (+) Transcript_13624:1643-2914(+)
MRLPCTWVITRSATSPGLYSSAGLASKLLGTRTSVAKPASKKTPNLLTVSTVPSSLSPCFDSDAKGRDETSTCSFAMFKDEILSPVTLSPWLYSERALASWLGRHNAFFWAPMSKNSPRLALTDTTVPTTSSPSLKLFSGLPSDLLPDAPDALASKFMETVTLSPSTLMTFTFTFCPTSYAEGSSLTSLFGQSTSDEASTSRKMPNLLTFLTVPSRMVPTSKLLPPASSSLTRILRSLGVLPVCSSKTFRPSTVSPVLYLVAAPLGNCVLGQSASFSAPMSSQIPICATRVTLPSNVSPTLSSSSGVPFAQRITRVVVDRPAELGREMPRPTTAAAPTISTADEIPPTTPATASAAPSEAPVTRAPPRSAPPLGLGCGGEAKPVPAEPVTRDEASNSTTAAPRRTATANTPAPLRRWHGPSLL